VLLDSDVIIWCLRGRQDVVQQIAAFAAEALPACSALSVLEIEIGMKKGEETATRALLSAMDVQPVDGVVASQAAMYIRTFRRRGITLDFVDACIAATCVLKSFQLATLNRQHYPMPGLRFAAL
jgi:predicted nucleic acid-binding protein